MSLLGKLSLSLSGLSLIIIMSTTWILGGWINVLYIFLILFLAGLVSAFVLDYKLYLGFLLMKTTKNGMSMGVSVLITLVFCASIAYLSAQFKVSLDVTEEKINSLAPQTVQLIEGLEENMYLTVFYKGKSGKQKKDMLKRSLLLFKQKSSKIKIRYYDAHIKHKLSQEYLNNVAGKESGDIFIFAGYKGKKVSVAVPFNEEKLSSAMIKATRREEKTVYFLSGHGERDPMSKEGDGISELKEALLQSSFQVKTWNFVANGKLPGDVSALIIAGPERPYLEKELNWLEKYLNEGGRLLMALDPDKKHNMKQFLQKFGVDYQAHYIRDRIAALVGLGPFSPMGVYFDPVSRVTKSVPRGAFAIFHIAGPLKIKEESEFALTELVKTNPKALAVTDIGKNQAKGERSAHALALLVEKVKKAEEAKSEKEAKPKQPSMIMAVFGDSDFFSNDLINKSGINRDLVMNTVSYLVDESDLISIRPKRLKATQVTLRSSDQMGVIFFAVALPVICFIAGFVIWFRRREA